MQTRATWIVLGDWRAGR